MNAGVLPPRLSSSRRLAKLVAALTVASFLASTLLSYSHLAAEQHEYCAEHGQFEEEASRSADPGPGSPSPAAPNGHDHHGCQWLAFAASPVAAPGSISAALQPPAASPAPPALLTPAPLAQAPLLLLAPKTSPPVAAAA